MIPLTLHFCPCLATLDFGNKRKEKLNKQTIHREGKKWKRKIRDKMKKILENINLASKPSYKNWTSLSSVLRLSSGKHTHRHSILNLPLKWWGDIFWKAIRRVTECLANMLWLVLRRLVWLILWSEALALTERLVGNWNPGTQGVGKLISLDPPLRVLGNHPDDIRSQLSRYWVWACVYTMLH